MIGEEGIQQELDLKNIAHLGGPADGDKKVSLKAGEYMEHDHDVSMYSGEVFTMCDLQLCWSF